MGGGVTYRKFGELRVPVPRWIGPDKPLVYIAGPYTNPDPVENIHRAVVVADSILDVCWPVVPHLTGTWHMISPKPYDFWLAIDLELMKRCDAVYRYPGASSGADAEVIAAVNAGLPVVYTEKDLRAFCG